MKNKIKNKDLNIKIREMLFKQKKNEESIPNGLWLLDLEWIGMQIKR